VTQAFAKLFDTSRGQLLAFKNYDAAEDEHRVTVIGAAVRGVEPKANLGYDDERRRDAGFEKIDQVGAEQMAEQLFRTAESCAPKESA
jgi:hypothetical protein